MHEQPPAPDLLLERVVDGHHRRRLDAGIVDIGRHADDASRVAADAYEPDDAVGPHQVTVERVLTREELPRDAAADDHDALGAVAVSVVEVAAGDYRDAEGRKEARRHRAGARVWVVRRVLVPGSFDGEREAAAGAARVAPRHRAAERNLLDARHLAQAAPNLAVEPADLLGRASVRHHRDVDREHVVRLEAGLRRLEREQRAEEHARAGEQHEGRRDLCDGERAQTARGAAADAEPAARQAEPVRSSGRRQARNEREQDRRGQGEADADPQQARVEREVEGADGEARGVPREHGDHRLRDRHAQQRAAPAEQHAFREQRPSERGRAGAERGADRQL